MPVLLASGSAAAYGLSDYIGGVATRRRTALRVVCASYPLSVLVVAVVSPLAGGSPTPVGMAWGLASGVAGGLAVWTFYAALARGPMSVISPLTAVLAAAVPLGFGLAAGERPGTVALFGTLLAVVATVLVSLEGAAEVEEEQALDRATEVGDETPPEPGHMQATAAPLRFTRGVAALTALAGLTFAAFFVLLDRVPEGEGLWPVTASRVGATLVVAVVALVGRSPLRPDRTLLRVGLVLACVDVAANVAFYYATRAGMLSVVSVLASLYPAFTVALALTHGGERLRGVQVVGLVLAGVAVGLITLG